MAPIILALIFSAHANLNFKQALIKISEQNPVLKNQIERVNYQVDDRFSRIMSLLPSLSASYGQEKSETYRSDNYSSSLRLTANVFNGGADYHAVKAGYSLLNSERRKLEQTQIESQLTALNILIEYLLSIKNLEILHQIKEAQKKFLELSQKRYERGLINKSEIDKSEVDLLSSESKIIESTQKLKASQLLINSYLPDENLAISWPYTDGLLNGSLNLKTDKDERRKDIETLSYQIKSLEDSYYARMSSFIPRVDLNYQWINSSSESGYFNTRGDDDRIISLNFTWSIFNGFKDKASLSESHYLINESKNRLSDLERDLIVNREIKMDSFQATLSSFRKRLKAKDISKKIYQQSIRFFNEGKISFNDLEIDQNRYLDTELKAIEGEAELHRLIGDLCLEYGHAITNCL